MIEQHAGGQDHGAGIRDALARDVGCGAVHGFEDRAVDADVRPGGETERAGRIRSALETTIKEGTTVTRDLGGSATTDEFTDAIIAKL